MNGLPHGVVAPEGERDVGDTARGPGVRKTPGDLPYRLDEVDAVVVVLLDAGGDGEHVGVEDDVLGREADFSCEDLVGAPADLDLSLYCVRLARLVEGHDDHRRAVALYEPGLPDELLLALFQADGVYDRLALHPFQPGLDDGPPGRVDHDGHPRDVRLGGHEVEEPDHRLLAVEHPLVHVDVYDLGAVLDLLARHVQGRLVIVVQNKVLEARRAGDVGALAYVHEQGIRADVARFQPREPELLRDLRDLARRVARDGFGHRPDVLRRRPAAAADDVQPSGFGPFADLGRHHLRRLVVLAKLVGQAGVRVGADGNVGNAGEFLHVLPELLRAERAVQADADGVVRGAQSSRTLLSPVPRACVRSRR